MTTLNLFEREAISSVKPTKLRKHQERGIQKLRDRVREGKKRILLVAPVAAGKMVMIASIIRTSSVPVLVVVDRKELIEQCVEQLARLGITNVGVMRADDDRTDPSATIQVASIQTLARRKKPPAGLLIVDEAHISVSDSYIDLFEHYKEAIILGFTATPARLDNRPLGNIYECMEIITTYAELIKEKFIVVPECYDGGPDNPNLQGVQISGGDYNENALAGVMRETRLVGGLVDHWLKLANKYPTPDGTIGLIEGPYRRTLTFAVNIAHSHDICERFSKAGVRVAHLDGETKDVERARTIKALTDGEIQMISSCNIFLKGTDIPSAKCALHARPTQSLVLARQSVGRIMRPWHPGCPPGCMEHPSVVPLFLDHASIIAAHGFPHEDLHWELNAKPRRFEKRIKLKLCKACFAYIPPTRMLCPYCGGDCSAPDPEEENQKQIQETKDQLVRRSTTPEDMKRAFFDNMVKVARHKGNKPGFASAKYKEHYGAWPPWDWSEQVKASFACDPEWQAALEKKQTEKEARAAAKKAEEADADERTAIEEEAPLEAERAAYEAEEKRIAAEKIAADEDAPFDSWLKDELE